MGLENLKLAQKTPKRIKNTTHTISHLHFQQKHQANIEGHRPRKAIFMAGELQPYTAHSHAGVSLVSTTSPVTIPNAKELHEWIRFS